MSFSFCQNKHPFNVFYFLLLCSYKQLQMYYTSSDRCIKVNCQQTRIKNGLNFYPRLSVLPLYDKLPIVLYILFIRVILSLFTNLFVWYYSVTCDVLMNFKECMALVQSSILFSRTGSQNQCMQGSSQQKDTSGLLLSSSRLSFVCLFCCCYC